MNRFLLRSFIGTLILSTSMLLHAEAKPKFLLTPTTPTKIELTTDDTITVQYTVLNQTKYTRTLTMVPIAGISQVTTGGNQSTTGGVNTCSNPFVLQPNESCRLTLTVSRNTTTSNIFGGPKICKTKSASDNTPDPLLCSQPAASNQLTVIWRRPVFIRKLTVSPSTLSLTSSGSPGQITVTNNSRSLIARNIAADFTGTALNGNITQDASNCISVEPEASCILRFTPGVNVITLTSFPIKGDITRSVAASIEVTNSSVATISVTNSPLIFDTNSTGTLTIKNDSTTATATAISADLAGTALEAAGVRQDATNCTSVSAGGSCTLTFTSNNSTAVPNTTVIIKSAEDSLTSASIAVNGSSQTGLVITQNATLVLSADGTTTGSMSIQNIGVITALDINANFTGTALNGMVSVTGNTCSNVPTGGICTLTYTPGTTPVSATNFVIQGSNTTAVEGTISLIQAQLSTCVFSLTNMRLECTGKDLTILGSGDSIWRQYSGSSCIYAGQSFDHPATAVFTDTTYITYSNLSPYVIGCSVILCNNSLCSAAKSTSTLITSDP